MKRVVLTPATEAAFRRDWANPHILMKQIEARYGHTDPTLRRVAAALGLEPRSEDAWTDAVTADVVHRYAVKGESPSQIARIHGMTRNQVTAKLSRMNHLRRRASDPRLIAPKSVRVAKPVPPPKPPKPPPVLRIAGRGAVFEEAEVRPARVVIPFRAEAPGCCTVLTIGPRMCRWPIGDPEADDFTFCGARADGTYCPGHHMRSISAYQPDAKPRPYAVRGG